MAAAISRDQNKLEEWQALLQPWLDALKEAGLYCSIHTWATVSDIENVWPTFRARASRDNSDAAWQLRVEAMELLELLARVDRQVAWDLLVNHASNLCEDWVSARYKEIPGLPRFELTVTRCERFATDEDDVFNRLLDMTKLKTSHSVTFEAVKGKLLTRWSKANGGRPFIRTKEGRVEVVVAFAVPTMEDQDAAVAERVFAKMELLVTAQSDNGQEEDTKPLSLSFSAVIGGTVDTVSSKVLSSINRVASMGIRITRLGFHPSGIAQENMTTSWSGFLQNHVASIQGCGVEQLSLNMGGVDVRDMEALSLAMVHSRSLCEVDFAFGDERSDNTDFERWLWLAYGIFSKEAGHGIHTVRLNMELLDEMNYVEVMQAVLRHDDPLAFLYEYLRGSHELDIQSTASTALLKPFAVVSRGHFNAVDQTHELVAFDPSLAYRIVRSRPENDYVEFVLPGIGVCWTLRSEILETRRVVTRERHAVRHLSLHNITFDRDPRIVIALLELVGEPIERLTLNDIRLWEENSDEFFDAVLASLPNLKRLDLNTCRIAGLGFLDVATTRLESLHLHDVGLRDPETQDWGSDEHESWTNFMEVLSDPMHALASSLRELSVDFQRNSNDDLRLGSPDSVVEMLSLNNRLLRCDLVQRRGSYAVPWTAKFLAHNGEPLPGRLGPLPPAETLAFLSVVTGDNSNALPAKKTNRLATAPSAQYKLNTESVRLILELAALTPRRSCIILAH